MPSSELEGKVALVTGGGRGIGANIAREVASAGMDVWVTGRTAAQVESVAAEIGGHALVGDVSKRDDVERWAGEAGAIDLLVCNAGMSGPGDVLRRAGGAGGAPSRSTSSACFSAAARSRRG